MNTLEPYSPELYPLIAEKLATHNFLIRKGYTRGRCIVQYEQAGECKVHVLRNFMDREFIPDDIQNKLANELTINAVVIHVRVPEHVKSFQTEFGSDSNGFVIARDCISRLYYQGKSIDLKNSRLSSVLFPDMVE